MYEDRTIAGYAVRARSGANWASAWSPAPETPDGRPLTPGHLFAPDDTSPPQGDRLLIATAPFDSAQLLDDCGFAPRPI
jgi:hypothetical protein